MTTPMTNEPDIGVLDKHLDAILRASGSTLRHYSMQKTLDDMRAALCAAMAETALRAQGWQPIETAPVDGSWIQCWRRHGVKPLSVKFDSLYGGFENEDGDLVYHLTHWMPLPAAPSPEGE